MTAQKKDQYSQEFEQFWGLYPRREGHNPKWAAYLKFQAALKLVPVEKLVEYVNNFRASLGDKIGTPFVPMARTWLHQRGWEQYMTPLETPKSSGPNWDWVCQWYKKTGKWLHRSPEPGLGGVECPEKTLRKYGLPVGRQKPVKRDVTMAG